MKISNNQAAEIQPPQTLEELRAQNRQLVEALKEGKAIFKDLKPVLDILQGAKGFGMITLKLPRIIYAIQENNQLINKIAAYIKQVNEIKV